MEEPIHPEETSQSSPQPTLLRETPKPSRHVIGALLAVLYAGSILAACVLLWRGNGGNQSSALPPSRRLLSVSQAGSVGWVSIHGAIYQTTSGRVWERGMEQWSRRIQMLADKSSIKALVLDIDSPGGSVGAVQELHQVILRVRKEKKKPVVALVGDVAASGGYYLAASCDRVVAHPGSLLGSIGVIFNTLNVKQLLDKVGVKSDPIKSGELKDIGSPTRAMTPEERRLLQSIIDDAHQQFLTAVAEGRRLPVETVKPLADGRIFTGRQALGLKLVDMLGGAHEAIKLAGELGGIAGMPKVERDAEPLGGILEFLDSTLSRFLRPEALLWSRVREMSSPGLEYRWTGGA